MSVAPEIEDYDWLRQTASVVRQATSSLGEAGAREWLETPVEGFDGRTPLEMLTTESGGGQVQRLLDGDERPA